MSSNNVTIDAGQLFGIGVLIASSVSLALYVIEVYRLRRKGVRKETLEDRIKQLTMALLDASKVVGKVETEIEERRELVRKLEQDAETYKNIANLHKSELDAVGQVFRGELKKERRRGFIQELSLNLFFFLLGVAVTFFLFRR